MIRYAPERKIRRNARLGKILMYGGMGVLVLGLILSIAFPEPEKVSTVLGVALVGVLTSQFGMVFYNRWSRRPRMDEVLDDAVKGLDARYAMFHYTLGSPHVLISPAGVFALVPRMDEGEVAYEDGRWTLTRVTRSGPKARILRGIEGAAQTEADAAASALRKQLPESNLPDVKPMFVFLSPKATVRPAKEAPLLAVHAKKIKETLRQLPKRASLAPDQTKQVALQLGLITDSDD